MSRKLRKSIGKYNQSLKMKEELGDKSGIAYTLGQIGRINEEEGEYNSALRNYLISFSIFEQLNSSIKEIVARSFYDYEIKWEKKSFILNLKSW